MHMRLVPNFLEQVCKIWHESPSTSLHFNAISEGSGETVLKCSLARSLAARKFDMFHEVALKFGLSCHLNPFFFRDSLLAYAISTNRSVHELTYKIWPMPSSTSLLSVCFAKVQVRLRESAFSPDPSLLAHAIELAYKIWLSLHLHLIF